MRLVVQKYGGTSVGTPERICHVAQRILETQRQGCRVVAVVSAMAGVTDELIRLGNAVAPKPTRRELDILLSTGEQASAALTAMAVNGLGGTAISLTGAQAGILTDRNHSRARIANISPKQIHELLADDYVVIVAGFQGQTPEGETTTLGRGGSDLSAIALAGGLSVLLGYQTRLGAWLLVLFLIPVTLTMLNFWAMPDARTFEIERAMFLRNVTKLEMPTMLTPAAHVAGLVAREARTM